MSFNSSLLADLTALFNDNTSGDISAADGRTVIEALLELAHPLDHKPGSADTPDDDFTSGTLDAKWTPVAGASGTVAAGTVSLLSTTNQSIYDLATRPGTLLTQVGRDGARTASFRQDYTLPDNSSIVVSVCPALGFDGSIANDEMDLVLAVNSDNTSWSSGTNGQKLYLYVGTVASGGVVTLFASDGTTTHQLGTQLGVQPLLMRIARAGNVYTPFVSFNGGRSWNSIGPGFDLAGAKDNIWIAHANVGVSAGPVPVCAWDWVRQGSNNLDPW